MKFVEANQVGKQKLLAAGIIPTHYIFTLDDSGSMSGSKWTDLMQVFGNTINTIRNIP